MKYVYAIRSGMEAVKFGSSNDPIKRLAGLQVGNEEDLILAALIPAPEIYGHVLEEVLIHAVCREEWKRGEWFHYRGIVRAVIDVMQQDMVDHYQHHLSDFLCAYILSEYHGSAKHILAWAEKYRPQRPLSVV